MPTQTTRTLSGVVEGAGLLVSIGVGGGAPLLEIDRLGAWFGLTPAEGRLVAALAGGDNLQDYAARRNVSLNAVRFLLKGVYRKDRRRFRRPGWSPASATCRSAEPGLFSALVNARGP